MSIDEFVKEADKKVKGEMIIFISGKGGLGKTTISVNTAIELANKGFSTCILDGNFQFGDVNVALDIQQSYTISDIIGETKDLQDMEVYHYLDKHSSGLNVLSAPIKPEEADLITNSAIKIICNKILEENNFLIVDLPSGLFETNLIFMEMADKIFLVTDSSFIALKNTKTILRTMNMLNMNEKISVVINNFDIKNMINIKDIQNILNVNEIHSICNNSKIVSRFFTTGVPFVISKPKEKISKDIILLASKLYNRK